MKSLCFYFVLLFFVFFSVSEVWAEQQATPKEVYQMVVKAANVLENLGEDALSEFNKEDGEFVWKNTYVWVLNCSEWTNAAHPFKPSIVGPNLKGLQCKKTGKYFFQKFCEVSKKNNGGWVEYWWPKPGKPDDQLFRKITYVMSVPNTDYQVAAGIYNDDMTIEELNKTLR